MHYLISLGLTLVLEGGFALALRVRGRDLLLLALVNVLTNPLVVLANSLWGVILLPELLAVAVEAGLYGWCRGRIRHPVLFALGANVFSYTTGVVLQTL